MTETTTQDHVDTENLVDAAERAAREAGAKTVATIRPDQQRFDEAQVAMLRQLGIENATQGDLDLFFHYCRTTGLDPFRKQIYMIGRNTKVVEWVEDDRAQNGRRRVDNWVTKWTIQTGIDGYRRNAREAAKKLGDELAFDGPYWCGEDGEWKEIWPAKTPPTAAKFTVFRNGEAFSAVAHYDEFVQTNAVYEGSGNNRRKVGDEPNSMWDKMPRNQTAKCAEAMAYRRAYPDDFAGLILEDSVQPTVIDQDGNIESEAPKPKKRPGGRGTGGLRDRARAEKEAESAAGQVVDGEVASDSGAKPEPEQVNEPAAEESSPEKLRQAMLKQLNGAIFATFGELGLGGNDQRPDRLVICREIVGRQIESTKELTDDELQKLRNGLISRKQSGTLEADVTEWLNADAIRQEEARIAAAEAESPKS